MQHRAPFQGGATIDGNAMPAAGMVAIDQIGVASQRGTKLVRGPDVAERCVRKGLQGGSSEQHHFDTSGAT